MSDPRQHHYIPRFYLRGFVNQTILKKQRKKEVIWVYERAKSPRASSPDREARERDFYAYKQGASRNVDVEDWLSRLEQKIAPITAGLRQERQNITDAEREWLALFIGIMQTRTPANRRLAKNRIDPLVDRIVREAASDPLTFPGFLRENCHADYMENFNVNDPEHVEALRQAILSGKLRDTSSGPRFELFSMIEIGRMLAALLLKMNWLILYSEGHELFLTSDDPVVTFVLDEAANKLHLREGMDRPGVNIHFPLCDRVSIRITKSGQSGLGRWTSDASIRYLNKLVVMCADRWVYAPEQSDRIKNLFDRKGGKVSVDTIDLGFEGRRF